MKYTKALSNFNLYKSSLKLIYRCNYFPFHHMNYKFNFVTRKWMLIFHHVLDFVLKVRNDFILVRCCTQNSIFVTWLFW